AGSVGGTVEGNTFSGNTWGMYVDYVNGASSPVIRDNTFTGNTYPVYQGPADPVYSGNTFSGNTYSVIGVGGSLSQDVVWEQTGIPYLVTTDVNVPSSRTLTVDGGVVVKFNSGKKLTIQGTCLTVDAVGNPVIFTSYRDDTYGGDTNGDGSSNGSAGDWAGIYFQTTSNIFDHAVVRYAGLSISGPAITIRQVTFDYTPDPAIRLASGGAGTNVHNSNFLHAGGYGIRNDTTNTIDALNNYWGHPSGPGGVGPGSGAGVTNYVTYSPWLTSQASMTATGPVITSSPNTSGVILDPYRYDADGRASASGTGTLVWSRILGPTDFFMNSSTGEITWSPTEPGDYIVGIAVTDDVGSTDQIWQVRVAMSGDTTPPTVVSHTYQIVDQGGGLVQATLVSTFNEGVQVRPIDVALLNAGGQAVQLGSLSYDIAFHRLTVVAGNLSANATYTYRLLDTITDDALNPLDGEFDGYTFPTGDGTPGGNFAATFVADLDEIPPALVSVSLNHRPGRTVSDIEPSGIGVRTIQVTFSEAVFFDAWAVDLKAVEFSTGAEVETPGVLPAVAVTGSGTNVMTITLGDPAGTVGAVDTWVKVTLAAAGITDAAGNALDGEPENDSSGLGYIYDAVEDLPSGNGVAGGDAVFYVGSLRGDMRGFGPFQPDPNGIVDQWDLNGFTSKYTQGHIDADFRGFGPFQPDPNGIVDQWDLNGFTSRYTQALTNGTRLWPLPVVPEGAMAMGSGTEASALATPLAVEPVQLLDTAPLSVPEPLAARPAAVPAVALPVAWGPALPGGGDEYHAATTLTAVGPAVPLSPWVPGTSPETSAEASSLDAVDLLAGPALEVALVA
ncbi:MAG TPA: Ig-like domain-containing protein, partial [Phycisphaerae bacterium]|nr:Ig-like domain-containing protein [Phycisphaerae bacterium]